jgi:hypothetical protein
MFSRYQKTTQPAICNFVPGFAFYEGIGGRLAEVLVEFFEAVADLAGIYRT